MCLFKWVILVQKQYLGIFDHSDVRNKSNQVDKIHFLFCIPCIFKKVSKVWNWLRPLFKTVSSQNGHFGQKAAFSNLWELKHLVEIKIWLFWQVCKSHVLYKLSIVSVVKLVYWKRKVKRINVEANDNNIYVCKAAICIKWKLPISFTTNWLIKIYQN